MGAFYFLHPVYLMTHKELKADIQRLANKLKGNFTDRAKEIAKELDIPYTDSLRRRVSEWAKDGGRTLSPEKQSEQFEEARKHRINTSKKYHIFTSAQNATPIHTNFWQNLKAYAEHLGADLHVVAYRYKNPTSMFVDKDHDWWDTAVVPYLDAARHSVHKYMMVLSDVKTQPTAVNPLSGMRGISGMESCIIGHPKMCLESVPVLNGYPNKLLLTTGACTIPNYTDSAAGKKGEFHHQYGAVVLEIQDDNTFHVRQITADDSGTFHDLWNKVEDGGVTYHPKCKATVLGDLHFGEHDNQAIDASLDLLYNIKPSNVILHDIFSGYSISHHERNNPFIQAAREGDGTVSLEKEMEQMLNWVEVFLPYAPVIPAANHNFFVDRWLQDIDWRKYPNRQKYIEYASVILNGEAPKGIVAYEVEKRFGNKVKCLDYDDSFRVGSWELGVHGDLGANGSRASINQYKNFNTKMIVGHSHTPARQLGVMSVGTLTKLRLNYNKGASSWLHSNVILHDNDKCQHVNIIKGEYTTL